MHLLEAHLLNVEVCAVSIASRGVIASVVGSGQDFKSLTRLIAFHITLMLIVKL